MNTRIAGLAALALALLLVGGVAVASIPAPDGTINGCRQDSTGNLRAIDSEETCPSGWSPLNWPSQDRYAHWTDGWRGRQAPITSIPANSTATVTVDCFSGPFGDPNDVMIYAEYTLSDDPDLKITRWWPNHSSGLGLLSNQWSLSVKNNSDTTATGNPLARLIGYCVDGDPFP
jgi:hypothetical protein